MPDRTYLPDLASLDTGFPAALPVPALLRDFAHWIADKPRSSLGWFHLQSDPLSASYVRDDHAAEHLRERLGCFLQLANGSRIALWLAPEPAQAPHVVYLGADHKVSEIAPTLEAFLFALARTRTGIPDLDREPSVTRAALADWLLSRGLREPLDPAAAVRPSHGFADWFGSTLAAARANPAAAQGSAAAGSGAALPGVAPPLPRELFELVDPLLGLLADDARVIAGFEALGIDLSALRDPASLRCVARAPDGVSFELAWPWDYPSHWLEAKYPKPERRELEQRRARMLWGVTFYLVPDRKRAPNAEVLEFAAYQYYGRLPLELERGSDLARVEALLGQPTRGRMGSRVWDDIRPGRTLSVLVNEGPFQRTDLEPGTLRELTWRVSQSS